MPQMAPISWLILFFIFTVTMILFNILNYYCNLPKSVNSDLIKSNYSNNSMNWKW
uniref:ATP synthase complex subunit 8 n=1 Tax=Monodiamesa sp. 1 CZ-2021a TaxID=2884729 RepID=A0A8K1NGE8_9DIPT|nr:ATP synthase F0 subunit 8 [Monodiamesa sp. 1 CZ-2021a]